VGATQVVLAGGPGNPRLRAALALSIAEKPLTRTQPRAVTAMLASVRPQVRGKFLSIGEKRLYVRGVTYGTFRPDEAGNEYTNPETVETDFALMAASGVNAVRTYNVPPIWLLDTARRHDLRVMIGLPWEQHITFLDHRKRRQDIEGRVRAGVAVCAGHPAVLCYTIGNEIPAPIVRWHGAGPVRRFVERLYRAAKTEDPGGLVTYVNYPSTEYLELPFVDLHCFNVYLEREDRLAAYLARLQSIAGDSPLLLAEIGLDSRRNGEAGQARALDWQLRSAFAGGCAGAFVFSWTDDWYRGGYDIDDWDFGLTTRAREPKLALQTVKDAFEEVPFPRDADSPRVSVVVCSYNGERVIRECAEGLSRLEYPNFEVIVVDDGSTDATAAIARDYGFKVISTENRGLSSARNTGLEHATGELIAYLDDDAYPDPHWLSYLANTFMTTDYAGVGGPNIPPRGDGFIAECVANAPGGPLHVMLTDTQAEHIPGCNMAFRTACLKPIGGFDPQFRVAGDDVDVCWRLQEQGWTLGFNACAMVFHHRRNSIRAYWRQQRGYGKAEALLERKWPEKYNSSGHVSWSGRLYGKGLAQALAPRRRIYHGTWGSAPFQSIYQPAPDGFWVLPLMPEWYLVAAALALFSALGLLWKPLFVALPLLAIAVAMPLVQAGIGAARACLPTTIGRSRFKCLGLRGLIGVLHLLQPLARLRGRLDYGLTPWRRRGSIPWVFPVPRRLSAWSEHWHPAEARLRVMEETLRKSAVSVLRGGDFDRWDLEARGGVFGRARGLLATEEHGASRQLVRFRCWPKCSSLALAPALLTFGLAIGAALSRDWPACAVLGLVCLLLLWGLLTECATATGALFEAFKRASVELGSFIDAESPKAAAPEQAASAPAQDYVGPRVPAIVAAEATRLAEGLEMR